MARFRRKAKSRSRGSFFRARASRRRGSSGVGSLTGVMLGGAAYGAGRQFVASKLQPITSKVPFGNYADNAVMGVLAYFLAKGKIPLLNKVPMSREIGKAGLYIESAMVGQEVMGQTMGGASSSATSW